MASNPTLNTQTPAAPHDQKFGWGDVDNTVDRNFHQRAKDFIWRGIKKLRFIGNGGTPDFYISGELGLYSGIFINNNQLFLHLNGQNFTIDDPINIPNLHEPGSINFTLYGNSTPGQTSFQQTNTQLKIESSGSSDNYIQVTPNGLAIQSSGNSTLRFIQMNNDGTFWVDSVNAPILIQANSTKVIGCIDYTTNKLGFVEGVQSGNVPYKVASAHFSTVTPATNSTIISYPVTASGIYQVSLMVFGSFTGTPFKVTGAFTKGGFTYTKDLFPCGTTSATLSTADQFTYPAFTVYCDAGTNLVLTGTYSSTLNTFNAWAQIYKLFET